MLKDDILGYVEFHIEQGPVLENTGAAAGSCRGHRRTEPAGVYISGPRESRGYHADASSPRCSGRSGGVDHRGRERTLAKIPGLVATVGKIEAKPGATNVIAGEARLTLDVRHGVDEVRTIARSMISFVQAEEIAKRRGLSVSRKFLLESAGGGDGSIPGQ